MSLETTNNLKQFFFHPSTIIVMLILDWGGVFLEIPGSISPFFLVFLSAGIFALSFVLSYLLQHHFAGDSSKDSLIKALVAGLVCAVPYPVMASVVGTIILALSGFNAVEKFGVNGLIDMFKKRKNNG